MLDHDVYEDEEEITEEDDNKLSLSDCLTLNKEWKFHYTSEPFEVMWDVGSVFRIDGFSTLVDGRVILELVDESGRYILISEELLRIMFTERQMQLPLFEEETDGE